MAGRTRALGRGAARLVAGTLLIAAAATIEAAQVPVTLQVVAVAPGYAGRAPADGRWLIYLDGPIDPGATSRVVHLVLGERITRAVVYLNSPGGSLVTAMQLGRVLREHGFETSVGARAVDVAGPSAGTCYSACPFVFAGGVQRHLVPGSVLGVHRAENRVPVADEAAFQGTVAAQVARYLAAMGIGPELAAMMSAAPHDQIRELTVAEAVRMKLVDPAD